MRKIIFVAAALLGIAACVAAGREIRHPRGCEERLENPYKRAACIGCLERPLPHVFLPDNPEGERCIRR